MSAPVGTEGRIAARRWLADASRRYDALCTVAASREVRDAAARLLRRHEQARARLALKRLLRDHACGFTDISKPPLLIAAGLRPCGQLHVAPVGRDRQQHVAVWGFVFGATGRDGAGRHVIVGNGLWSFACSAHALGRLLERDPAADAATTVLSAHSALLAGDAAQVCAAPEQLLLPTSSGAFLCRARRGMWQDNDLGVMVLGDTWLAGEQLHDHQQAVLLRPAADAADALAALPVGLLNPVHMETRQWI